MFQPGPNDALSQNFMKLGILVAEKNVDKPTHRQRRFMFYNYRYCISVLIVNCITFIIVQGEMKVTPACFAHFVNLLRPLASGKLALLMEVCYLERNFGIPIYWKLFISLPNI